ncbi:MAG: hypothetical protein ACLP3K_15245 [Candidatus Acidiferrales bacterium]
MSDIPDISRTVAPEEPNIPHYIKIGATTVALLASIAGLVVAFVGFRQSSAAGDQYTAEIAKRLTDANDANAVQIQFLLNELHKNQEFVTQVTSATPAAVRIAKLQTQVNSLQTQLNQLNEAIGQSPEKALAIPLLKKDMDDFRDVYRRDMDSEHAEVDRVYDQNKWFIGLMFTLALGVMGLAVSNFVQVRRSKD